MTETPDRAVNRALLPPWQPLDERTVIRSVRCLLTAPDGVTLVVVKVDTNVDGLYGLGCSTFTQRAEVVKSAVENYLAPALIGRDPADVTDIYESLRADPYWRGGPVLNNALSGVDMALWDIKGKQLGVPVWQLLGGRCRSTIAAYTRASGRNVMELIDEVQRVAEQGYRHIRCDIHPFANSNESERKSDDASAQWDQDAYVRRIPDVFRRLRDAVGDELELIHDVHERVEPHLAVRVAASLDSYNLFFLEDPVATEDLDWIARLRAASRTPVAVGELLTTPREYLSLIQTRCVDFIRCHISAIGGITPAWRIALLSEQFGIRTAWHGPRDVSPIGQAANVALDTAVSNFGIQEYHPLSPAAREVFPGAMVAQEGVLSPPEEPGLGVDIDEVKARQFPPASNNPNWPWDRIRKRDGSVQQR